MAQLASPRRVHDLELLVGALTLLARGPATEEEIYRRLRTKARDMRRRRIGSHLIGGADDEGKGLAKSTVGEILRELDGFGLMHRAYGYGPRLTAEGARLAKVFVNDHANPNGMHTMAALHLSRFPNLRRILEVLEQAPDSVIFIPRPTPADLGVSIKERRLESYGGYIEAAAEYAAAELRQWGVKGVRSTSVLAVVRKAAEDKDRPYRSRTWNHPNMIDTIRDALSRFALGKWIPNLGVVDFEIFCSRGSTLGLLNYTDRLDGAFGRVVYPTSWTSVGAAPSWIPKATLAPIEYRTSEGTRVQNVHSPTWSVAKGRFLREILSAYDRLNQRKRTLYVQVADMRDMVCYAMRLTDHQFDRFLERVFHDTMQGRIEALQVSFEADEVKEIRGSQSTKRNPLYLASGAPRTTVMVARRSR